MQSVAAVYNRLERAAQRHDRSALNAWMGRRSDNAMKEAIKHGLRMANDPDYRLGVEAYRFAKHYEDAADERSGGLGAFSLNKEQQQRVTALREGAGRLRYGGMTDAGASAIRREVERLLGVMRAEIDAERAPAPPSVAPVSVATGVRTFPVRGFAASTLDAEADGLRDDPDAEPFDEDDAAIRVVVRAYEAGNRKALIVSSADADTVIAGLTALANTEDERAEIERKKPASKRDPESQRMARAASDGLSALSMKIARAFA